MKISKTKFNESLEKEFKQGNDDVLQYLFPYYKNVVTGYICTKYSNIFDNDEINEIVCLTFEKFVKNINNIRERFQNIKITTWLVTTARNTCLDEIRKIQTKNNRTENNFEIDKGRQTEPYTFAEDNLEDRLSFDEDCIEFKILFKKLKTFLESLPEDEQILVQKRFVEDKPYKQIADEMKMNEQTARFKIHSVRQRAVKKFKKEYIEYVDLYSSTCVKFK